MIQMFLSCEFDLKPYNLVDEDQYLEKKLNAMNYCSHPDM